MSKRPVPVQPAKKDPHFVGTISQRNIEAGIRKDMPRPTQVHRSKKSYSRRPKHRSKSHDPAD